MNEVICGMQPPLDPFAVEQKVRIGYGLSVADVVHAASVIFILFLGVNERERGGWGGEERRQWEQDVCKTCSV